MTNTPLLIEALLTGFSLYALFWLWKKGASRWNTWFPALRKGLEWSLFGAVGLWVFQSASLFTREGAAMEQLVLAFVIGLALPVAMTARKRTTKEEVKRGSTLADSKKVARQVKQQSKNSVLELGGVPIPLDAEPYHLMIAGSTGTGKSVAISTLLEKINARGDTVIMVDSGGGFLSKYFRPDQDFVFNPYDDRCVGWSPTAEMTGPWDAQALARSIVPDGTGDAKEWNSYAQTFIASVLRKLWETNRRSLQDFLYFVQAASIEELEVLLEGTPAASQLAAERTFGSIRTIAGNYVASYEYLPVNKETFSVAEMVKAEHSGTLFITYRDDQLDSLRSLIACLLDVAARTILSLEPNPNRRVWLIIDEFASIGKVQSIEQVATKARKAGGCLVVGLQSISQLKDRYGEHGAQTILSCLSTWLVLRCADADTADYMSKYIGEAEVEKTQRGSSQSDSGESETYNEQSSTQRVVLASEIQAFANLNGLLKLAGDYPVCKVKLNLPAKRAEGTPSFEERDFTENPLVKLTPTRAMPVAAPKHEPESKLMPDGVKPASAGASMPVSMTSHETAGRLSQWKKTLDRQAPSEQPEDLEENDERQPAPSVSAAEPVMQAPVASVASGEDFEVPSSVARQLTKHATQQKDFRQRHAVVVPEQTPADSLEAEEAGKPEPAKPAKPTSPSELPKQSLPNGASQKKDKSGRKGRAENPLAALGLAKAGKPAPPAPAARAEPRQDSVASSRAEANKEQVPVKPADVRAETASESAGAAVPARAEVVVPSPTAPSEGKRPAKTEQRQSAAKSAAKSSKVAAPVDSSAVVVEKPVESPASSEKPSNKEDAPVAPAPVPAPESASAPAAVDSDGERQHTPEVSPVPDQSAKPNQPEAAASRTPPARQRRRGGADRQKDMLGGLLR